MSQNDAYFSKLYYIVMHISQNYIVMHISQNYTHLSLHQHRRGKDEDNKSIMSESESTERRHEICVIYCVVIVHCRLA